MFLEAQFAGATWEWQYTYDCTETNKKMVMLKNEEEGFAAAPIQEVESRIA